ncbi:MAG: hypothetical protein FWC09_06860, partial [Lachnospiraceae bacterium]|nr:hypothetical protein [Lachnospiraceae bacterium]
MKAKLLFYILLCALVSLTGCGGGAANNPENNTHDMISFDGQIINVGEPNQLESPVMIFEAYMSGSYFSGSNYAPYLNGYVILYNSGNETVDLNGYSVVVGEDDGTVLSERTVSLSGSIDPGSFFVVEGGPTTDASPDVPSGEALPFEINISANNFIPKRKSGVIALYGGTFGESISPGDENIIDFLAYGNVKSGAFPEEALAPEPSVKRILRRLNFTNTYNNIVDFDRVNIVDNPSGILRFSPDLTAANVIAMGPLTKAEISLSHVSGFYQQELALMVNTTLAGNVKIYYTLDGSNPVSPVGTVSSSAIEYDGAIRIFDRSNEPPVLAPLTITTPDENYHSWPPIKNDRETEAEYEKRIEELFSGKYKGTTIKVAAIDDEHVATKVVSGSYYINNGSPGQRFGMPAISIIADQDSLFNPDTGIFMFKNLRGETASSTSVVVHYFDEDGRLGFTDNSMRFRLHGGGSRRFPQKSFRLYPSGDNLEFDLFNGR